ncbi:MAG TPA: hypothetical protein VM867_01505, partial [Xanthobacteraceae bacterium]|nr:hypothetical protein [Xanthobacteraceae bacterium]
MDQRNETPWIVHVAPVASDLPIVAEMVAAARKVPDTEDFDLHAMRAKNPERLGGPLVRQAVEGTQSENVVVNGVGGEWISVSGGSNDVTIFYFHGGAFIRGSLLQG